MLYVFLNSTFVFVIVVITLILMIEEHGINSIHLPIQFLSPLYPALRVPRGWIFDLLLLGTFQL